MYGMVKERSQRSRKCTQAIAYLFFLNAPPRPTWCHSTILQRQCQRLAPIKKDGSARLRGEGIATPWQSMVYELEVPLPP